MKPILCVAAALAAGAVGRCWSKNVRRRMYASASSSPFISVNFRAGIRLPMRISTDCPFLSNTARGSIAVRSRG